MIRFIPRQIALKGFLWIVRQIIKNANEWDINRDGEYHKVRVIRKTLNIGPSRSKTYLAASKVFDALQAKKIIP
jgi:hypothetical protein